MRFMVFKSIVIAVIMATVASAAQLLPASTMDSQASMLSLPPGKLPIKLQTSFKLLTVHEIDDEAETFKFSGILTLVWKDKRQAFDPLIEGINEKTYSGNYQFSELSPAWYPQVILANAIENEPPMGVILRVKPDGTCKLIQTVTAEARATMDLKRHPFDKQRLEAIFGILGYNTDQVILTASDQSFTPDFHNVQVPQWKMIGVQQSVTSVPSPFAGTNTNCSVFVASFEAERKSFFMVQLVIIPLILIVILSWSVFWMDRSSLGDRMSVSFVGILTAVAYQTMVSDIMPKISYLTLMNVVINLSFFIMCATVVINLIVGNLDKKGKYDSGERLDLRCRWCFPLIYIALLLFTVIFAFL